MLPKILGLGLIQGWMWLFFMSGPFLFQATGAAGADTENVFVAFVFFTALSYLLVAIVSRKTSPLKNRTLLLAISSLLTGVSTAAAGFAATIPIPDFYGRGAVFFLAAAISGFGSVFLVTSWGELFSLLPVGRAGFSFGGAVTVGTILFFIISSIGFNVGMIVISTLPLFSFLCWIFDTGKSFQKQPSSEGAVKTGFPFPVRLVILVVLINLAGGFMYKIVALQAGISAQQAYWLTNIMYLAVCLLAGTCIYFFPDLDLRYLYRPVLPLLGAGFLLFPFFNKSFALLPFSLMQAGFALFDIYIWLLIVYLAGRHRNPATVIGWGYFLITLCILLGTVSFTGLFSVVSFTIDKTNVVSLCAAIVMIVGTLVFQERRETFSGWETANHGELPGQTGFFQDEAAAALLQEPSTGVPEDNPDGRFIELYNLTNREKEILLLLLKGRNNPYIRERLNISNNTIKTHLRNIYQKMGVNSRQGLLDLYSEFD